MAAMTTAQAKARILGVDHESPAATVVRSSQATPATADKAAPLQNQRKSLRQRLPTWPMATWITRGRCAVMADT